MWLIVEIVLVLLTLWLLVRFVGDIIGLLIGLLALAVFGIACALDAAFSIVSWISGHACSRQRPAPPR